MTKFKVTKKVDLGHLGNDWKDCYLEFSLPSYGEIADADLANLVKEEAEKNPIKAIKKGLDFLEGIFVSGKAIGRNGEKIDVEKGDLKDFPSEVINKCFEVIIGVPSKNA